MHQIMCLWDIVLDTVTIAEMKIYLLEINVDTIVQMEMPMYLLETVVVLAIKVVAITYF